MAGRQDYGRTSEALAEKLLRKKRHRVVARNYRTRHGEIDCISLAPDRTLVFTEVRSKHGTLYGHPLETIDVRKQAHVRQAAQLFLYEHPSYQGYACRFDVVTVVGEGKDAVLEHIEDAF